MRALTWNGVNDLTVERVPDPQIINRQDAIVKVRLSSVCGSDLHLIGGYMPAIAIDRFPERLAMTAEHVGCETIDYTQTDVSGELLERSGGRGPDVCIEAVGMEAHTDGPVNLYDKAKQQLRLESDRPSALREAIYYCRKGGSVFCLGVFGGLIDKFPMGARGKVQTS
ncbi:hypothetical protein KVH31_05365 [Streptomyces olivaceus]|uniref:hypothetical protein n=1 Tax=Streptomyces TaxID=1883 RepID=UPI001CCE5653|nr:hypothetical protein [Streptomyces olivaceus]MBZ6205938.1 hypothetical protein [Streptomyces olivaceus]